MKVGTLDREKRTRRSRWSSQSNQKLCSIRPGASAAAKKGSVCWGRERQRPAVFLELPILTGPIWGRRLLQDPTSRNAPALDSAVALGEARWQPSFAACILTQGLYRADGCRAISGVVVRAKMRASPSSPRKLEVARNNARFSGTSYLPT